MKGVCNPEWLNSQTVEFYDDGIQKLVNVITRAYLDGNYQKNRLTLLFKLTYYKHFITVSIFFNK